ncbi:SIS domain-containing protein [Oscillibacter sp.]|uniref:D-sedoheptulose-7-phosphate isomerase n=1 Tax=Oscillibacter sp. TaxID=1945593 RepID=UPI0028AA845D|nr:SIS domain-containing protein [Oscillibacter sp.]
MEHQHLTPEARLKQLLQRYPALTCCKEDIVQAFSLLRDAYRAGKKLLLAGNGGSAADSAHIVGELMKSFHFRRPADEAVFVQLETLYGQVGRETAALLEGALPAVALPEMTALSTAYMNDSSPKGVFAQGVYGLGKAGDVFLAISTSGNSPNVLCACMTARAMGLKVVGMTGESGGKMRELCDCLIRVPAAETFAIQEYHLPVYHALCAMLEAEFF